MIPRRWLDTHLRHAVQLLQSACAVGNVDVGNYWVWLLGLVWRRLPGRVTGQRGRQIAVRMVGNYGRQIDPAWQCGVRCLGLGGSRLCGTLSLKSSKRVYDHGIPNAGIDVQKKTIDKLLRASDGASVAPSYMQAAAKRLRVVLIQPPDYQGVKTLLPHFGEGTEGIGFKPPLGLLYVASCVGAHSEHDVLVIDAIAERLSFDELLKRVEDLSPDVVGVSAWTDFWYPAWLTGKKIKESMPSVHLTYGGPHLGIYPSETLDISFVDSVIVGDGELPFLYLCNMLSHGKLDNSFPGLHLKSGGVKAVPDTFYIHRDLDLLPMPDRTLLPLKNYSSVLGKHSLVTTMITSRGCPHKCTFCKLNFQKTLARSAESVVAEFRAIRDLGIKEVEIYDDTFTWSKKRLREICQRLLDEKIELEWAVRDRVSSVDPENLKLMYRAGCRRIHLGIESGAQHVIDRMKKKITLEQAEQAVLAAKAAGLTTLTYWMFGNLDETIEDMHETIAFAKKLYSDYAEFSITIPYAGTEMYDQALADGIITSDYWEEYARNPVPDFLPPQLIETHATLDQLRTIQKQAVRAFYFQPRFILRELRNVGTFPEFVRKARMGARLFGSVYTK